MRHSSDSARALQGELAGSCLPLRTGEKRPCATCPAGVGIGLGNPHAGKASVGQTGVSYAGGETAPMPPDLAPGRFSTFVVPVLRGRPDPTSSPNTGAAQSSVEGLTHRAIAVSVAA